jgi:hypothetical protein
MTSNGNPVRSCAVAYIKFWSHTHPPTPIVETFVRENHDRIVTVACVAHDNQFVRGAWEVWVRDGMEKTYKIVRMYQERNRRKRTR